MSPVDDKLLNSPSNLTFKQLTKKEHTSLFLI